MLVILLVGVPAPLMYLTLVLAFYLTVVELRELQPRPHFLWWAWWLLLVAMTHFVGYLILRVYALWHRRRASA